MATFIVGDVLGFRRPDTWRHYGRVIRADRSSLYIAWSDGSESTWGTQYCEETMVHMCPFCCLPAEDHAAICGNKSQLKCLFGPTIWRPRCP